MANPNLALLTQMAHAMGSLREQVVFVGGCATGLLLTQPEVADVRATEDVDAIVEVFTLAGYHRLAKTLRRLGSNRPWKTIRHHFAGSGGRCSLIWCRWRKRF